jgi:type IV pilus assembly protein PilC
MIFEYKALQKDGHLTTGEKEGSDSQVIAKILKDEGLVVISIQEKSKRKKEFSLSFRAFKTAEKISFARNIGSMLDAGLALSRALEVIGRQTKNTKTRKVIEDLNQNIKEGGSMSTALEAHPKIFNSLFVSMTKAGEESGNLADSFKNIAGQLEKNYQLSKKIKGAMVYPGVIIAAMSIVGFFMLTYIVPTLSKTFKELGVELPKTTQIIIGMSDFLQNQTIAFFGTLILIIVGIIFLFKSAFGKKVLDVVLVKAPLFGELTKQINSARTARTLSSLLKAGVPYLQAMEITQGVVSNHIYQRILEQAKKKVETGDKISQVFNDNEKYYPAFVGEMIAVGEETGELSEMLLKVAEFYEDEVEQKTKNMSTIIEPILMLLVGIGVGFFAISMISPMYSLVDNI